MTINNSINTISIRKKKYVDDTTGLKKIFGFWLYLVSDCIIFATMFSVYFVMVDNVSDGPIGKDIFQLSFLVLETMLLLFSTVFYGMVKILVHKKKLMYSIIALFITSVFGLGFVILELFEFYTLIMKDYGPNRSGFLSAFFTLIGLHGIHVFFGIIWILVMISQIIKFGLSRIICIRIACLGLFWHFLDLVWICIFTFVYLIGIV
ncbi:cytochrome o ubiquinol oxidase subunit III [Buchnera aphidicola]|uniref:cytochrome o ubiquinol oxidase subunit III n=1 Tax=Buchnera aphidicola TaxID=9 RepID=UPI003464126E